MKLPQDTTGPPGRSPLPAYLREAIANASRDFGAEAAEELERQHWAREATKAEHAKASAVPSGYGREEEEEEEGKRAELDAGPRSRETRQQRRYRERRAARRATDGQRKSAPQLERDGEAKAAQRTYGKLHRQFRDRFARDNAEQVEQAEALAKEAMEEHGIRHHYRPICKLAFFLAYMAALDTRGLLGLQILARLNVPRERANRVLEAMYSPTEYAPRRDIRSGKREHQTMFAGRSRGFGQASRCRAAWIDGERADHHPGAIRVLACFIFLWLSKTKTRRKGYTGVVRGFGRGLFEAMTRAGKSAVFGHEDGLPGAMLALKLARVIQYVQPPKDKVRDPRDLGPRGHAYNVYWFAKTEDESALDRYHDAVASLASLPALARMLREPELLDLQARAQLARPPPDTVEIDPADIPF